MHAEQAGKSLLKIATAPGQPGQAGWLSRCRRGSRALRGLAVYAIVTIGLFPSAVVAATWEFTVRREWPTASPAVRHVECTASSAGRDVRLNVVKFDPAQCTLAVIDDPRGDTDLAEAMLARNCLAGVNGGYFHPDRRPIGLVISDGRALHPLERAKLLSGLVKVSKNGRGSLLRPKEYKGSSGIAQALQAGPFLVDGGKAVAGLNATRSAARTVVVADAQGVRALLVSSAATLAEMGEILATLPVLANTRTRRALNLDGGSSTGLWVKGAPQPFYRAEWKGVRNYLAIVPR